MSPEQIRCESPAPTCDVYSFGITCYELACGRQPFRANSENELLNKHIREVPVPPTVFNKDVTKEFADLMMEMIRKKAADRPQSLHEFLSRFAKIRIYQSDPAPTPKSRLRRRPPLLTLPTGRGRIEARNRWPMSSASEYRLPFETPIYEMESRLAEMETLYANQKGGPRPRPTRPTRSAGCAGNWRT